MEQPQSIRIILVDDHDLTRNSLHHMLDNDTRFSVVAQCNNGHDAIEKAKKLPHDIILMDIDMTPVNGFQATQSITSVAPHTRIIGISSQNYLRYATTIISLGARGFVTKTSSFTELANAIEKVHRGEMYICEEIRQSPAFIKENTPI